MKPKVFVSYSHKDREVALWLANSLREYGIDVWVDEGEIHIGDSLVKKISEGIDKVDCLVAILSNNSVNSSWVQHELQTSMTKEINSMRVFVLPIKIDDCVVPNYLINKVYGDFRPASREKSLPKLVGAVWAHTGSAFQQKINTELSNHKRSTLSSKPVCPVCNIEVTYVIECPSCGRVFCEIHARHNWLNFGFCPYCNQQVTRSNRHYSN